MNQAPLAPLVRLLLTVGVTFVLLAALLWLLMRLGAGSLPGDLVIRRRGVTVYLPLATSLLLSVLLTLLLNLLFRR